MPWCSQIDKDAEVSCGVFVKADAPLSLCLEDCLSFSGCWTSRVFTVSVWSPFVGSLLFVVSNVYLTCPDIAQRVCSSGTWGHRASSWTAGSRTGLICRGAALCMSIVLWCSCTAVFYLALQNAQGVSIYLTFLSSKHGVIYRVKDISFDLLFFKSLSHMTRKYY